MRLRAVYEIGDQALHLRLQQVVAVGGVGMTEVPADDEGPKAGAGEFVGLGGVRPPTICTEADFSTRPRKARAVAG